MKNREIANRIAELHYPNEPNVIHDQKYRLVRMKTLADQVESELNLLTIPVVSVSLPSVDDAGIIAVEISEINNEMTAQEQAFFIAGFSECIKYLEMQSNER